MSIVQDEAPPSSSRLLVRCMVHYYSSDSELLRTIHDHATVATGQLEEMILELPLDVCERIVEYFVIQPVFMDDIRVMGCSSYDESCNPQDVLTENEDTWWISAPGSMPKGVGRQTIDFALTRTGRPCRVTTISIKIPPLPQGPLSLRTFQLEGIEHDQDIRLLCSNQLANRPGWQRFTVEVADCYRARLVCLSNQISMGNTVLNFAEAVGLYSIRFE